MNVGDIYETKIERLNHQGEGICIIENRAVFVKNALPEENVKIKLDHVSKKFVSAQIIERKNKNENRIEPLCPHYKECGGCDIMHMNYNYQHEFKLNKIKDIIKKFVGENIEIKRVTFDNQYYYRNKATFHIKNKIGYYKEKTNEIIEIEECLLASKEINETLKIIKKQNLKGIENIIIRSSFYDKSVMVIINSKEKPNQNLIETLKNTVKSIYVNNKHIYGEKYIIDKIGDYKFIISPESFFQVNTKMAEKLYNKVKEYAKINKEETVLDLYCGTGTIGLFTGAKNLVGIEINESAVKDAKENAKLNEVNATFYCGDSGEVLKKINKNFNTVIVDPPRSGLSKTAIDEIININPKKLVYVSCDPITLARDLNILKEKYEIKEISLFDLFPNTHHVESVCLLTLKNN